MPQFNNSELQNKHAVFLPAPKTGAIDKTPNRMRSPLPVVRRLNVSVDAYLKFL